MDVWQPFRDRILQSELQLNVNHVFFGSHVFQPQVNMTELLNRNLGPYVLLPLQYHTTINPFSSPGLLACFVIGSGH